MSTSTRLLFPNNLAERQRCPPRIQYDAYVTNEDPRVPSASAAATPSASRRRTRRRTRRPRNTGPSLQYGHFVVNQQNQRVRRFDTYQEARNWIDNHPLQGLRYETTNWFELQNDNDDSDSE